MKSRFFLPLLPIFGFVLLASGIAFALTGGPDDDGYTYQDYPLSEWRDISSSGILLALVKDQISEKQIDIGFDFEFYGNTYSKVSIASNGLLTFSPVSYSKGYTTGQPLPTGRGYADNLIAGLWDYLFPNHT